jgi:hypothetical protein
LATPIWASSAVSSPISSYLSRREFKRSLEFDRRIVKGAVFDAGQFRCLSIVPSFVIGCDESIHKRNTYIRPK